MLPEVLNLRQGCFARRLCMGVLVVLLTSAGLRGQTPKRNIFEDDPTPPPGTTTPNPGTSNPGTPNPGTTPGTANPNTPRPAAPVAAPAPGLAAGLIATAFESPTADARPREHHLSPGLAIFFDSPATTDVLPMSFTFQGVINVPAGGAQGAFHFDTTGDSELKIDGQLVSSIHLGDPAGTFEHQVNLPEGLHSLYAAVTKLHGTGARQHVHLVWKPVSGLTGLIPKPWCWHSKADEPADLMETDAARPARDVAWVKAGTPREADASARPDDILSGIVLAPHAGHNLDHLKVFGVIPTASFNLIVHEGRTDADGFFNESIKVNLAVKVDVESQCAFDCIVPGQLTITVDQRPVTRTGFVGEAAKREAITLKPGYHVLELTITKIIAGKGVHRVVLLWQVNNSAFMPLPPGSFAHYRWQEPYPDSVARGGSGQPSASQSSPGQPTPAGQQTFPAPAPLVRTNKLPVPDAASQAKAAADLRNRYAGAWDEPGTAQHAEVLIRAAGASRDDAVACYVLLEHAYRQAQSGGAAPLAFQTIDLLASQFTVDAPRLKAAVLQALGARRAADPTNRTLLLDVYNQAMAAGDFSVACDVANMSLADARFGNFPGGIASATDLLNRATAANAELEQVKPMLARLADNPNDAAANLVAARYYCFTARNWERGVPALARSSDPVLSWLGRHEATAAQGAQEQLALANGWWDAADGQPTATAAVMHERAAQWYAAATPNLAGLSRRVARRRIALVPNGASLPSPLASPAIPGSTVAGGSVPAGAGIPPSALQPGSAQTPASTAPPPVKYVPHSPNYPGPLLIVVDRAALIPGRATFVMSRISVECMWSVPDASVTVVVTDSPPQLIAFTAGGLASDQAKRTEIETALRAQPAATDLDAALNAGLKNLPARLVFLTDINCDADKIFANVNSHDPTGQMKRQVHMWCARSEQPGGIEKMKMISKTYHAGAGVSTDR